MGKVLSFGELLLRISPDADGEWLKENKLPFYVGGAEANVATALARWNVPSAYFTALPDNFLAQQLVGYLRQQHIDTQSIYYHGDRIGLYFLPKGKDLKNAGVIYDRAGSAFVELRTGMINWDKVLEGVSWFHFSAICPAISQGIANVCEEALKAALQKNITISVDLNYREKLWKYGKQPGEIMPSLVKYCHIIMGNVWAADKMLGIPVGESLAEEDEKQSYLDQAEKTSKAIMQNYPGCKAVANTYRFDQDEGIRYYTTLYTGQEFQVSEEYTAKKIIDKVGSGDCFMAGLIYGFYNKIPAQQTLEFATAAAFQKLFIESDATNMTVEDVKNSIHDYQQ